MSPEHQLQVSYKMNARIIRNKTPMILRMLREILEDPEYREEVNHVRRWCKG